MWEILGLGEGGDRNWEEWSDPGPISELNWHDVLMTHVGMRAKQGNGGLLLCRHLSDQMDCGAGHWHGDCRRSGMGQSKVLCLGHAGHWMSRVSTISWAINRIQRGHKAHRTDETTWKETRETDMPILITANRRKSRQKSWERGRRTFRRVCGQKERAGSV